MYKALCLILLSVIAFFCITGYTPKSSSINYRIDRTPELKYDIDLFVNKVYLNIEKSNVYHNSKHCRTEEILIGVKYDSFIKMTEYEAVLRGFKECPDCRHDLEYGDLVDIENAVQEIQSILSK